MKADITDLNFMDGMKELLGMDQEAVGKLLDSLDTDTLLALTDAISERNKAEAEKIISKDEDINDLFFQNDKKKKKHPVKPAHDHQFIYGDDVAIIVHDDETDKDKFISATVYKPNAPGNTVGVKIKGKAKMVDKSKIYKLEENVMGMIGIPNLQRMQQLAGIQSAEQEVPPPVTTEIVPEPEEPSWNSDESCPVERAMSALDIVATALPDIRLADLKAIRQKLTDIQTKMNESIEGSQVTAKIWLPVLPSEGRTKKKI